MVEEGAKGLESLVRIDTTLLCVPRIPPKPRLMKRNRSPNNNLLVSSMKLNSSKRKWSSQSLEPSPNYKIPKTKMLGFRFSNPKSNLRLNANPTRSTIQT